MGLIKKVCIAGKNNIAVDIAHYLLHNFPEIELFILINKTDNGYDSWQKSLKNFAKINKILVSSLDELYQYSDLLFLSLEYDRIIDPNKFKTQYLYNLHFSKLPKYKGMYTSVWPLLNGEEESGVTLHQINTGIDTGNIVSQKCFALRHNDTARDLYFKYIENGILLMKNNISMLLKNNQIVTHEQNAIKSSYYSKNSINFSNICIDLKKTAFEIHNQIRAFTFREFQLPSLFGYEISSSRILNHQSSEKPGEILKEDINDITIATIDFDIILTKSHVNCLFEACKYGDLTILNEYLPSIEDIDIQNAQGWTMLIVASYHNHEHIIIRLLEAGANINKANYKGTTPLMYAKSAYVNDNKFSALNILLKNGADIFQRDNAGLNVIEYCQIEKLHNVVEIIQEQIK